MISHQFIYLENIIALAITDAFRDIVLMHSLTLDGVTFFCFSFLAHMCDYTIKIGVKFKQFCFTIYIYCYKYKGKSNGIPLSPNVYWLQHKSLGPRL